MKPPKSINLKTWFRKYCKYAVMRSPGGRKYHFFWLPDRDWARIWPFWSNTGDYPEREISAVQVMQEGWHRL